MRKPEYQPSLLVLSREQNRGRKIVISGKDILKGDLVRIVSDKTSEYWFGLVSKVVDRGGGSLVVVLTVYYERLDGVAKVLDDDLLDLTVTVTNPNDPPSTSDPTPDVGIIDSP